MATKNRKCFFCREEGAWRHMAGAIGFFSKSKHKIGIILCDSCWREISPLIPSLAAVYKQRGKLERALNEFKPKWKRKW